MNLSLLWLLLIRRSQETPEGCERRPMHHGKTASHPLTPSTVPQQSSQDHQLPHTPRHAIFHLFHLRKRYKCRAKRTIWLHKNIGITAEFASFCSFEPALPLSQIMADLSLDSGIAFSLLPSDFWVDIPFISLIFPCTLAMTVTLYSAPSPFLLPYVLYKRYALSLWHGRNNTFHCISIHETIINQIKSNGQNSPSATEAENGI